MSTLSEALATDLKQAGAVAVQVSHDERTGELCILAAGLPLARVLRTLAWEALLATHQPGRLLYGHQKAGRVAVLARIEEPRS